MSKFYADLGYIKAIRDNRFGKQFDLFKYLKISHNELISDYTPYTLKNGIGVLIKEVGKTTSLIAYNFGGIGPGEDNNNFFEQVYKNLSSEDEKIELVKIQGNKIAWIFIPVIVNKKVELPKLEVEPILSKSLSNTHMKRHRDFPVR